jgi:hypothetical protein
MFPTGETSAWREESNKQEGDGHDLAEAPIRTCRFVLLSLIVWGAGKDLMAPAWLTKGTGSGSGRNRDERSGGGQQGICGLVNTEYLAGSGPEQFEEGKNTDGKPR